MLRHGGSNPPPRTCNSLEMLGIMSVPILKIIMDKTNTGLNYKNKKKLFAILSMLILMPLIAELLIRIFYNPLYLELPSVLNFMLFKDPEQQLSFNKRIRSKESIGIEEDRYLFWRLTPNTQLSWSSKTGKNESFKYTFSTNSYGFRGPPVSLKKQKNSFRIMCMGDSATFATGVPQNYDYPRCLEKLLKERYPSLEFNVINAGVPGYSSFQGRILFERVILNFEPDIITLSFGANDTAEVRKSDEEVYRFRKSFTGGLAYYFMKSRLVGLIRFHLFKSLQDEIRSNPQVASVPRVNPKQFEENYTAIINEARQHNIQTILIERNLLWTEEAALYPSLAKRIAQKTGVDYIPSEEILKLAIDNIITDKKMAEVRDHYNSLYGEKIKQYSFYYVLFDMGHPNPTGHEILAEALYEEIIKTPKFKSFLHQFK